MISDLSSAKVRNNFFAKRETGDWLEKIYFRVLLDKALNCMTSKKVKMI
jgi:hypothetical protein